jgi:hypothetical protein
LHTHLDGGVDMLYKDMRIDIKATLWTRKLQCRFLQWPITKVIKSDVILLTAVNIDAKSAIIVGYALPHDVSRAPINQDRDYACHEIAIPKLRKASQLLFAECRDDLYPSPKHEVHRQQLQLRRASVTAFACMGFCEDGCRGCLDGHHIKARGEGGDDVVENIISLCRWHHNLAEDRRISKEELFAILALYHGYQYEGIQPWTERFLKN